MNIDNLTIGDIKKISNLINMQEKNVNKDNTLFSNMIGKYVIVRSRNEGINAGTVVNANKDGICLKDARRLYYHSPKDKDLSWYEGVAKVGLSIESKISNPSDKTIIEDYSITECTEESKKSIMNYITNHQS